jgi:hypothetical protein
MDPATLALSWKVLRALDDVKRRRYYDAMADQLLASCCHIGNDHLHTALRPRRHVGDPGAHDDRARGAGRCKLHKAQRPGDLVVVVGIEADLVDVEGLSTVDVGNRYGDELNLPIHARSLSRRHKELVCKSGW